MARCAAGMAAATTMTTSTAAGECIGGNSNASDRQGGCQQGALGVRDGGARRPERHQRWPWVSHA